MADPKTAEPVTPAAPLPAAAPAGSVTLYDKKTNAPVLVDPERAHSLILSGELNYAPGTRVPVRVDGKIGTVDADALGDAVNKYGAKPVTGKEFHEHELQKQYGSKGQAALAFGASALDSATIGASNAVIGGIGGKDTREYLRNIEEANPTASTAGEVAGFVGPIAADVFSGGTLTPEIAAAEAARIAAKGGEKALARAAEKGLARTALETATLGPTRAVSAIGGLAEDATRAIVGRNAETRAARVAQNIIAGGVRGAVEGGIYGVGAEAGHQFLQDNPDLTGETLGTAWAHGALIGGALGGATHGFAGLFKKAPVRALAEESAIKAEGREVGAETKALGEAGPESGVANRAADAIISQVDDPEKAKLLKDAWKHKSFEGHDNLLKDATRKVTGTLDEAIESGHVVDMNSFGEAKSNYMAKLVPAENVKPAQQALMDVWKDATKTIEGLEKLPMLSGEKASINRLRMWLDDFGNLSDKSKWKDPAELFDKIDDFKRRIGKEAGFGKGDYGRAESTREFNQLYDRTRLVLENDATWGAAAVAQKEVNLATANMIDTNSKFLQRFTSQYGSEAITGAPKYIADSAKVNGFINGLTSAANDTNTKMAADYVAKRSQFLDAVTKNYDLPADALKAVTKERAALKTMAETITQTSDEVARINKLKSMMADERGHSIHGIIGMAIDAVTKPGLSLARLAELEATKNRAVAKIDKGIARIKSALGGGETSASGVRRKPGLLPRDHEGHDSYEKRRASVIAAASQPDVLHANLQGAAAPINPHSPDVANAMQRSGLRTVQYLMTVMPKPQPRSGSLTPQVDTEKWTANDQQKDQFNRRFDAAVHPDHVLTLVANGTVTPQHVEALAATRPAMYQHMKAGIQADLAQRTKPVPFEMQGPIKTFLGLPQMDPQVQKMMQANYAAPAQPSGAPKKPLKMSDTMTLNASNLK